MTKAAEVAKGTEKWKTLRPSKRVNLSWGNAVKITIYIHFAQLRAQIIDRV